MMDERPAGAPADGTGSANELSGSVAGHSVQAGVIRGDVHFHEASGASWPVPRQLLAPSAHFTNRDRELVALDELLATASPAVAVLSGPGGVGKTALALWWSRHVQDRFADGQLYVDLAGFSGDDPVDPGEALGLFLRALGVSPQRVPVELAEQAALYRSVTAERSLLVVLDNAYSAAQVRVLLPASATSAVVVTSRSRLVGLVPDGARLIEVGPLPLDEAVMLLARAVGQARIDKEQSTAEELVGMCGGLPIAVCLAAARLAARPRLSVSRVAAELADERQRLGALSTPDSPSVQAVFDVSYRFLSAAAAAMYRRLGLHPGQEFSAGLLAALVSTLLPDAAPVVDDILDTLLEATLIEEIDEDRFRFHDLLRLHAQEKARTDDTERERDAALRAMLEWYLAAAMEADRLVTPYRRRLPYEFASTRVALPAIADRDAALSWLERERVNLIGAARAALERGWPELAWHLSDVMWPLLLYRKHYRDRLEIDRRGVEAASAWGNAWAEAEMLKRLGRVCTTVGNYGEAERHLRASMARFRKVGDRRGAADAQEVIALLYLDWGRRAEAVELFQNLLAINHDLKAERSVGLTLINLGLLLPQLGRSQEALDFLREAQTIFARISDADPYNGVRVLLGLASAHLGVGEVEQADVTAAEAARLMRELGSEHGEAEALELLGEIAHRRGNHRAALRHYRKALTIFRTLGSSRTVGLRGRIDELRGDTDGPSPDVGHTPASDLDP